LLSNPALPFSSTEVPGHGAQVVLDSEVESEEEGEGGELEPDGQPVDEVCWEN
jgi:hypothetical protein